MFIIQADKSRLYVLESEMLVSTAINVYTVRFEFSEDWADFTKVALFYNNEDRNAPLYSTIIDSSNTTTIPTEVLQSIGGTVYVGVCGEAKDPDRHLPTVAISLGEVREGICDVSVSAENPTPDLYQQILTELGSIRNLVESGALVGPPGPRGPRGEQGPSGKDGGLSREEVEEIIRDVMTELGVTSFNDRTGAVKPADGDYTAAMVGAADKNYVDESIRVAVLTSWEGSY